MTGSRRGQGNDKETQAPGPRERATAHLIRGEFSQAEVLFQQSLRRRPDDPVALHHLAIIKCRSGSAEEAVPLLSKALRVKQTYPEAWNTLGHALKELDRVEDAAEAYRRALAQHPSLDASRRGLASIELDLQEYAAAAEAHQAGSLAPAEDRYRALLKRRPRCPEALHGLGLILLQRGETASAVDLIKQAIFNKPTMPEAFNSLGAALKRLGLLEEAIAAYREAIKINTTLADAHFNLGHALVEQARSDEAIESYKQALRLQPAHAGAMVALAHQRRHSCDWNAFQQDAEVLKRLIGIRAPEVQPFHVLVSFDDPALQQICAEQASERAAANVSPLPPRRPTRRKKLRLGYLSSDYRRHPVAWLIPELIERHDRSRYEVYAYSHGVDDRSPERQRLERAFDKFRDVRPTGLSETAALIRADKTDILIDLNGHTLGARTGILAHRPAPVQVAFLGYPGTMGARFIDYTIGDPVVTPADIQQYFTERLVRLPNSFQPSDTKKGFSNVAVTRSQVGLPDGAFVFCCFNNSYKITPPFFDVWMRLLKALPHSVLWLLDTSPTVKSNLQREARCRGIAPERIVFAARADLGEYFGRYSLADLFLDTLPYNAGTTANDALWAGLPVLTCAGQSFAGRMASSLLTGLGLQELITHSLGEYEQLALALARDSHRLQQLRTRLGGARKTESLFNMRQYVSHLEGAYEQMWEMRLRGKEPDAFSASH